MTTQARTFFRKGDSKGTVIQFIGGNFTTELSSSPLHFALGLIKNQANRARRGGVKLKQQLMSIR